MIHPTYSILVDDGDAQTLVDALNRPRNPESGDPGLGPSTAPSDATNLTPLAPTNANPSAAAKKREITLSVAPGDEADRLQTIVDSVASARLRQWHPSGHPVDPQTGELDRGADAYETPAEHRAAVDVGRITPDEAEV